MTWATPGDRLMQTGPVDSAALPAQPAPADLAADALSPYLTLGLLEQLAEAVTVIGADWRYRYVSPTAAAIIGRPAEACVGQQVWALFPEVVGTPQHDACLRAMRTRSPERVTWFFDTVGRWYEQRVVPTGDGLLVLVDDITEHHRAESRAEMLVQVGEALAGALTAERVNSVLVEQAFPLIGAAAGTIVLADEERGVLRAMGWSGADADTEQEWDEYPLSERTPGGAAFLTGAPVFLADLEEVRERFPAVLPTLQRLGRHTLAALPLISADVRLGALLVNFESSRTLGTGERQFLTTTAAMAAQALMRANLLDAEGRSVRALQRSLLPQALPQAPGLELAVRYVASDAAARIGGDWYDVVALPGGAVALVMGDVEGHDLEAAALMGLVRSAVRAYALEGQPPAIVLSRTNAFLAGLELGRMVTVAYAQLHPGERLITTVSAGHPPTQVVAPDGTVREVPAETGPPLGVHDEGLHWLETTSTLDARSALAMYTDGLVETRAADLDEGTARVRAELVACRELPCEELADALLGCRGASSDDVALLVARLTAEPDEHHRLTRRLPATPASVFLARRFVRQLLHGWEVPQDVVERCELVVSELVTNAARHSEDDLSIAVSATDVLLRVEVADSSHRMPLTDAPEVEDTDTSGRGLLLVRTVSDRWGVESEGLSKQVWAEFDLPGT